MSEKNKKAVFRVPEDYPTVLDACAALWMVGAWDAAIVVCTGDDIKCFTYEGAAKACGLDSPENEAKAKAAWAAAFELHKKNVAEKEATPVNKNGRVYPASLWDKMAADYSKKLVALAHPAVGESPLAHTVGAFKTHLEKSSYLEQLSHVEALAEFGVDSEAELTAACAAKLQADLNAALAKGAKGATLAGCSAEQLEKIKHLLAKPVIVATQKPTKPGGIPEVDLSLKLVESEVTETEVKELLGYKASDFKQVDPFLAHTKIMFGDIPKIDLSIKTTEVDASKKVLAPVFTFAYDKDHPPSGPFKCVNPLIPGGVVVGPVNTMEEAEIEWNKQAAMYKWCGPKAFKEYLAFKKEHPAVDLTPHEASLLAVAPKSIKEQLVSRIVASAIIANMNGTAAKATSKPLFGGESKTALKPGYVYAPYFLFGTTPPAEVGAKKPGTPSDIEAFKAGAEKAIGGLSLGATTKQRMQMIELLQKTAAHMKDPEAKKEAKTYLFALAYGAGLPMPTFPSDPVQELVSVQPLPQKAGQVYMSKLAKDVKAGKIEFPKSDSLSFPAIKAVMPSLADVFMTGPGQPVTVEYTATGLTTKGLETLERFGVKLSKKAS